jgi:hypothetical protein
MVPVSVYSNERGYEGVLPHVMQARLRHYATSRKIAAQTLYEVTDFSPIYLILPAVP